MKFNTDQKDDDLLKVLSEGTEAKSETDINQDDFKEQGPEIDESNFSARQLEPEIIQEEKQILSFEDQAKLYIAFMDNSGSLFLPPMYQKRMFRGELFNKYKDLKYKMAVHPEESILPEEKPVYEKMILYKELVEGVPFTKEEINIMQPPLAAFLKKHNMKSSAEILLMIAVGQVIVPRLMPLFMNFE